MKQLGLALANHESTYKKYPLLTMLANAAPTGTSYVAQNPVPIVYPPNVWGTIPGNDGLVATSSLLSPPAGYSWIVRILPYMEQTVIYNNLSNASAKFSYPAFLMSGGNNAPGVGGGLGTRYLVGQPISTISWLRHPCTIDMDEVRCPSFSGDSPSTLSGTGTTLYGRFAMAVAPNGATPYMGKSPSPPWYNAITTNYKAMSASHMACMQNPNNFSSAPGSDPSVYVENPNGIIVPVSQQSVGITGTPARAITDGLSKTIMIAETKEQAFSSWYDGTTSWLTAMPIDNNSTFYNISTMGQNTPLQPWKVIVAQQNTGGMYTVYKVPTGGVSGLNYGRNNQTPQQNFAGNSGAYGSSFVMANVQPGTAWRFGPSSDHSGGFVLHAWGDAHVTPMAEDTDPSLYCQLCTKAGREAVSDPNTN